MDEYVEVAMTSLDAQNLIGRAMEFLHKKAGSMRMGRAKQDISRFMFKSVLHLSDASLSLCDVVQEGRILRMPCMLTQGSLIKAVPMWYVHDW
jgi:hypothetical protein